MKHIIIGFYYLLVLCVSSCLSQYVLRPVFVNETDIVPRVVNGNPVGIGEIPYQVGFKTRKGMFGRRYYTFCGGSILAPKKVLSAAHCFGKAGSACTESTVIKGRKLSNMYAVAGFLYNEGSPRTEREGSGSGQWRRLLLVMYPSRYKFPFIADIAIVMLKRPFIFNSEVNKISYARTYEDYRGPCLASGYGRISNRFAMTSDILLKAHLTMITTYWCNTKFRRNMKALVCTATTPTDISKGDSGGPLVCTGTRQPSESRHGVLVGVASGSRLRVATFFTRVSSFSKYIARNRSGTSYFKSRCLVLVCFGVYGFLIG